MELKNEGVHDQLETNIFGEMQRHKRDQWEGGIRICTVLKVLFEDILEPRVRRKLTARQSEGASTTTLRSIGYVRLCTLASQLVSTIVELHSIINFHSFLNNDTAYLRRCKPSQSVRS